MSQQVLTNLDYKGKRPNFERDQFDTLAEMKAYPEKFLDEGHLSFCKETGIRYEYKSTNEVDEDTGRWRQFVSGSGGIANFATIAEMDTALGMPSGEVDPGIYATIEEMNQALGIE